MAVLGEGRGVGHAAAASGGADKRFAAPEWQDNPIFRTLKEFYLLASDWLLRQASEYTIKVNDFRYPRCDLHRSPVGKAR